MLLGLLFLASCREVEPERDFGLKYFPMHTSAVWEYDVDSISFNAFTQSSDTFHYRMKLVSEDTLFAQEEFTAMHLRRYDSLPGAAGYQERPVITWERSNIMATVRYEERRLVKLVFPVLLNKRWDQNMYQSPQEQVRYSFVNQAYRLPGFRFEDCVMVTEKNDSNFFQVEQIFDVYANGVGLVHRRALETEVQNEAKSGYSLNITLIRFQP